MAKNLLNQKQMHTLFREYVDAYSQKEVADRLEISVSYVSLMYSGKKPITEAVAGKMSYDMQIFYTEKDGAE